MAVEPQETERHQLGIWREERESVRRNRKDCWFGFVRVHGDRKGRKTIREVERGSSPEEGNQEADDRGSAACSSAGIEFSEDSETGTAGFSAVASASVLTSRP